MASVSKRDSITIDREQTLHVDPSTLLPPDAEFKGYDEVVVQDISIRTDNVLFRKEVFYSRSTNKSYRAPLPEGYAWRVWPRHQSPRARAVLWLPDERG